MNKLVFFKGQVLTVQRGSLTLDVKDKNGVPTGQKKDHVVVKIQMLHTFPDKSMVAVAVTAFDPAVDFVCPKVGEIWETPEVRKYDKSTGFPEASI